MTGIIIAASIVGGVGILIGLFLGISGEKLKVEVNEKEVMTIIYGNDINDEEKSKTRWYVIKDQKNDPAVFLYRSGTSASGTDVWLPADRQYYHVFPEL